MSSNAECVDRFTRLHGAFVTAAGTLERNLEELVEGLGRHDVVSARAKDIVSFAQKILIKRYADPWAQITDKVGGRIVVAFAPDVDLVASRVESYLLDCRPEDKRGIDEENELSYSGVHLTGKLPGVEIDGEPVEVEVQVRTNVQDAWSVVSHSLVYKPILTMPVEERYKIMRLVTLAEIFDEEVARGMQAMQAMPGYEYIPWIQQAELIAASVGIVGRGRDLSAIVMIALRATIHDDLETYTARLSHFVDGESTRIRHLSDTAFTGAAIDLWENLLVGQAISVVVMERLTTAPFATEAAWLSAELPPALLEPFKRLFELPSA